MSAMKKLLIATGGLILGATLTSAQNGNSGTVNQMSTDPQQNQKATGTMGTTTGQPNDVSPETRNNPNGGVPSTTTMTGSGSNGDLRQSSPNGTGAEASGSAVHKGKSHKDSNQKDSMTTRHVNNNPSPAASPHP
jgi:hypothetical protein